MNMNEIPFTRLPTKLIYILDSDLLKMLLILIQQEDYWNNVRKLEKDGSFYKPMSEFAEIFRKKNLQDVRLMLQTLQSEKFIEIISNKSKKQANYYRINWNKIEEYTNIPIPQLIEFPLIKTAKRKCKSIVDSTESYQYDSNIDSTNLYQQSVKDSTESYHQEGELIVQDCTPTIDNIINKNNNITIANSVMAKSPLYDEYKKRIEELLSDYQQEADYIVALDKHSNIENILALAKNHIPTSEIENYHSQLSEASTMHDRAGWNITLDKITKEMMEKYHTTNIHNVKSPLNSQQFKCVVNDLLDKADFYIDSGHWEELADNIEKWTTHQWERDIISYDLQQETIEKVYNKLAS